MKRTILCLSVLSAITSSVPAIAQCCVSAPYIRWEEWHYDDYVGGHLVGHFWEQCNGTQYIWGQPDAYNVRAEGDCGD